MIYLGVEMVYDPYNIAVLRIIHVLSQQHHAVILFPAPQRARHLLLPCSIHLPFT